MLTQRFSAGNLIKSPGNKIMFSGKIKYLGSDRKTVFNSLKSQAKYVRIVFGSCARISAIK